MKLAKFPQQLLALAIVLGALALSGCATKAPVAPWYIQKAEIAISQQNWETAYRFLEDGFVSKNPEAKARSILLASQHPNILSAGFTTFSTESISKTLTEHGKNAGLSHERQRLAMYKVVAKPSDYEVARANFESAAAMAELSADAARKEQERLAAEKQRNADEAHAELERKRRQRLAELASAAQNARFTCQTKTECQKAFSLTQVFISDNADMKIQVATETIIETYNPTEMMKIGMKAVKIPRKGDSAEIIVTVTCRDEGNQSAGEVCNTKLLTIYRSYPTFVRSTLSP